VKTKHQGILVLELHDRVYAWLLKKSKGSAAGRIRCNGVLSKLCSDLVNDPVALRKALIHLRIDGRIEYAAGQHGEPVSGFMTVVHPNEEVPQFVLGWMAVLESFRLSDSDQVALREVGTSLEGFTECDMIALAEGLVRLRNEQGSVFGQQVFNVSARYLLSSSKLLTSLDSRALRSFGIEVERFASRPYYVVVGGNVTSPDATILVENPVAFETAVTSVASERCLFVCTFGFGLSASTNDYGNQLAGIVEHGGACVLNRSHDTAPTLQAILSHPVIQFWGDLDTAGLQIFSRLAAKIPQLELSALYHPMVEAIEVDSRRHPYVEAMGKAGQSRMVVQTTRDDIRTLLRLCEKYAVDQEMVLCEEIVKLAGRAFEPSHPN